MATAPDRSSRRHGARAARRGRPGRHPARGLFRSWVEFFDDPILLCEDHDGANEGAATGHRCVGDGT